MTDFTPYGKTPRWSGMMTIITCWPDGVEWHKPEGVVVNVILGGQNHRFKYTERNNQPKWQEKEQGDAQE